MIDIYKKTLKSEKLEQIKKVEKGSWVLVIDPSDEEVDILSDELGLERGHILDALDWHETPRLEIEGENDDLYIFLRFPFIDEELDEIRTMPVLFILTDDFVATVSRENQKLFDDFLTEKISFYTTQKSKFLSYMFLRISLLYRGYLNTLSKKIRGREDILGKISSQDIINFVRWENILNDFLTALVPASNMYRTLLSKHYLQYFKEDQEIVEDIMLSNDEAIDICKTNIKTIVNLREAYSTLMTNNLNRAIKFLTAITIILTLPTMIASIYGMNITLPFQEHPLAFAGVMGATVLVVVIAFVLFKTRDWL